MPGFIRINTCGARIRLYWAISQRIASFPGLFENRIKGVRASFQTGLGTRLLRGIRDMCYENLFYSSVEGDGRSGAAEFRTVRERTSLLVLVEG